MFIDASISVSRIYFKLMTSFYSLKILAAVMVTVTYSVLSLPLSLIERLREVEVEAMTLVWVEPVEISTVGLT